MGFIPKYFIILLIIFNSHVAFAKRKLASDLQCHKALDILAFDANGPSERTKIVLPPFHPIPNQYPERILKNKLNDPVKISILTAEQVQQAFKELAARKDIPYFYPENGCHFRGQREAMLLEEKGIIAGKAFQEGALRFYTPLVQKGYVDWWFHVAPIVAQKKNGKSILMVLDPALFGQPVSLEEWYNIQIRHPEGRVEERYYTERFNCSPQDKEIELSHYRLDDLRDMVKFFEEYLPISNSRAPGPGQKLFRFSPSRTSSPFISLERVTVKFIKEEGTEIRVAFHQIPTIYYLQLKNPHSQEVLESLQKAIKDNKEIKITYDQFTLDITDLAEYSAQK